MSDFSVLGIDAGTTSCKAAVFDEQGRMLSFAQQPYQVISKNPGWAEIDAEILWQAVIQSVQAAVHQTIKKPRALAISSQGEGIVPVSATGIPVGPVLVSYDLRSQNEANMLCERFGRNSFFDKGGQIFSSVCSAAKVLWFKKHQSMLLEPPAKYLCVGDYLLSRLGVGAWIDPSLAARTMFFDHKTSDWRPDMLDAMHIDKKHVSQIVPSGTKVGSPPTGICETLGLSKDIAIIVGGHDQPCALLGAGGTNTSIYSLGTTETLVCSMNSFHDKLYAFGLPCYPHVVPKHWVTLPGNFTGGNLLAWFAEQFCDTVSYKARADETSVFSLLCEEMSDRPTDILVQPHFTTTGSPYHDSNSFGAIINLHLSTTRGEYIRSLLEGVSYEILLNLNLLEKTGIVIHHLHAVGGGTKSLKAVQLRSDVLGRTLYLSKVKQSACRGAALLAAIGAGLLPKDYNIWSRKQEYVKICPNPENHVHYVKCFSKYRAMYPALKGIYKTSESSHVTQGTGE